MTTLERLARGAYEATVRRRVKLNLSVRSWETESQDYRDIWIANTRVVVEGLYEIDPEALAPGLETPRFVWEAALHKILEERT